MFAGEVDLKTWYKPKIDKKTLKELSKRSDTKGLLDISIFIVALILSGYLCIPVSYTHLTLPTKRIV